MNANIMKTQIFHKMRYDLKGQGLKNSINAKIKKAPIFSLKEVRSQWSLLLK